MAKQGQSVARQDALRQRIFELADSARRIPEDGDRLHAFFTLTSIEEQLGEVGTEDLSSIADKQFLVDAREQCHTKITSLLSRRDNDGRTSVLALRNIVREFMTQANELDARSHRDLESASPLIGLLDSLEDAISQIDHYLRGRGTEANETLPFWNAVQCARAAIGDHRRAAFRFKCLILVAQADGLSEAEREFLSEAGKKILLSPLEADALIQCTTSVNLKDFRGSQAEAIKLTNGLRAVAELDGSVSPRERAMIRRLARVLKVPDSVLADLGTLDLSREPRPFEVVEDGIRMLSESRTPSYTGCGDSVHAKRACKALEIPRTEPILLAYSFTVFRSVDECAALTTRSVFFTSKTKNLRPSRVTVNDVLDCQQGLLTAELVLANGRRVSMNGTAGPFLKLCVSCVRAGLKEV